MSTSPLEIIHLSLRVSVCLHDMCLPSPVPAGHRSRPWGPSPPLFLQLTPSKHVLLEKNAGKTAITDYLQNAATSRGASTHPAC